MTTKKRVAITLDESLIKMMKVVAIEKDIRYSEIVEKAVIAYLAVSSPK